MAEITTEAFVDALRDVGIVPESAQNVSIRGDAGGFVRISYDEIVDGESTITTRRMGEADARGIERLTATSLIPD